jgi:hypothetical protein
MLVILLAAMQAIAADRIWDIEFFGHKGIDTAEVRRTLAVQEGDRFTDETESLIRKGVLRTTGKEPTDVAAICCDEKGNRLLFIGLRGESYKSFAYLTEPTGNQRLPLSIIDLYKRLDGAIEAAVRKGGDAAQEDDSQGYALLKDPAARALQLEVRQWALKRERELMAVLEFSSAVEHRRVAGDALGYARQSRRQVARVGARRS